MIMSKIPLHFQPNFHPLLKINYNTFPTLSCLGPPAATAKTKKELILKTSKIVSVQITTRGYKKEQILKII